MAKQPARRPGQPPANRRAPRGPVGPWTDRVSLSPKGHAFRPNQVICRSGEAKEKALAILKETVQGPVDTTEVGEGEFLLTAKSGDLDVELVVDSLRRLGLPCDPNFVLFTHSCSCGGYSPFAANPFYASSVAANPFYASAVGANPFYASPFYASPFYASPFYASPHQLSGERPSSARPGSEPPSISTNTSGLAPNVARCFVLDTGMANDIPTFLKGTNYSGTPAVDRDYPDESLNGFLDPASGHGTFIAGIIEQIAPGQRTYVRRVLSTMGDGDVAEIAKRLDELRLSPRNPDEELNDRTVINLSFGGYADVDMPTLRTAIEKVQETGAVVVASAGNDGLCNLTYPAAFPGVVGVGAIEATGPAPYSNRGPWVRACAPGTSLTSSFHPNYNGDHPFTDGIDIDDFDGWAVWTGTSFASPVVAAALLRQIALTNCTANEAVATLIDAPGLFRVPGLGTVMNVATELAS